VAELPCALVRVTVTEPIADTFPATVTGLTMNSAPEDAAAARSWWKRTSFSVLEGGGWQECWMLLARGSTGVGAGAIPRISQTTLAAMVGATRLRTSYFPGKFRRMSGAPRGRTPTANVRLLEKILTQQ
jgi:hypothetical protein